MEKTTWRATFALAVLLAAMAAGCAKTTGSPTVASAASGGPRPTATPSAQTSFDPDAPIKYSRCMRENGMTWFPDPQDGKLSITVPSTVDKEKFEEASEACRQYAPDGGERPQMDPAMLEQARQMSRCMRENGVPDFPDPNSDGSLEINGAELGTGPGDPTFDAAEEACSQYRPSGAVERHAEGPGVTGGGA
ncbi:hypothetical protein [Actinoplanes sp. GCM10030250]|uniref:hypothetical protein n=1 Tax=Actinoplanes sp. GCM10030250 TaxID=3273376 RepID=UPI0036090978